MGKLSCLDTNFDLWLIRASTGLATNQIKDLPGF
jgi:hypothetical protein